MDENSFRLANETGGGLDILANTDRYHNSIKNVIIYRVETTKEPINQGNLHGR
jgi:hypothetical protein